MCSSGHVLIERGDTFAARFTGGRRPSRPERVHRFRDLPTAVSGEGQTLLQGTRTRASPEPAWADPGRLVEAVARIVVPTTYYSDSRANRLVDFQMMGMKGKPD